MIVGEWSGALNPASFRGAEGGEQDRQRREFVRAELEVSRENEIEERGGDQGERNSRVRRSDASVYLGSAGGR